MFEHKSPIAKGPAVWIFALLIASCTGERKTTREQTNFNSPNIIFVLADDLGYGDLGCYGQTTLKTPVIDRMAAEGMRFTQCYAGNTVCCPSRSSLLTGLHPGHARHRGNYAPFKGKRAYIPFEKGTRTIASYLKKAGYATGHVGKWHLGGTHRDSTTAIFLGFDHSYSHFQNYLWTTEIKQAMQGKTVPYYPDTIWRDQEKLIIEENLNKAAKVHVDELYTKEALRYIRENKDNPFFLYLAYTTPHAPQVPYSEEPFADRQWPEVERKFAAELYFLDQNMEMIFRLLKDLGIDDNTVVLFSSDNGAHHEGGHDHQFFDSNGPLRGYKRDLYEGGIRVPMIARWPGTIPAGTISNHICAFWDLLPTFCELARTGLPTDIDGISIVPSLMNNPEQQAEHDYMYWEIDLGNQGRQAVRMGKWKAVRYDITETQPFPPVELYDLASDEGETTNIADQHPDVVKEIEQIFSAAHVENPYFRLAFDTKQ
jgi:arylsulfatase A-like enzyme